MSEKRKIEFGTLKINDISKQHIQECLDNNWVTMGPKTKLFEKKWEQLFNYPYTTMFNSGTSADMAACMALYEDGAKPGDEIICPALSFIATANAIRSAGFVPRFVDVNLNSMNIDIGQAINVINSKTVAIMGVNLMGKPCDLVGLQKLCEQAGIFFIVDNCEAYGCKVNNKYSLSYSNMEVTSHYIAHITTAGEMGGISCKNKLLKIILESIRSHGRKPDTKYFDHPVFGLNLRPTDLHASIGLGEVEDFWAIFNKRKDNFRQIRNALNGFEDVAYFVEEDEGCVNAPHAFSIVLKSNYKNNITILKQELDIANIEWKRNFGSMPHHKCFEYLNYTKFSMPVSQYIGNYGLHIGCHQHLTKEDLEYVCDTLKDTFKKMVKG